MDGSYPDSLFQMWALLSGIGETWDLSTQILILAGRESRTRIRAWFSLFGNQPLTCAGPMQGRSEPNCMVQAATLGQTPNSILANRKINLNPKDLR